MNTATRLIIPALVVALTGCLKASESTSPVSDTQKSPALTQEFLAKKNFTSVTYSTAAKTYVIHRKPDPLARADKILTQVTRGTPFTATNADDAEVQNMLRDAYRKLGLCPDGLHPGLLNLGYGAYKPGGVPTWSAFVRCSDKVQKNIPTAS